MPILLLPVAFVCLSLTCLILKGLVLNFQSAALVALAVHLVFVASRSIRPFAC